MPKRTFLYPEHQKANAQFVDFAGWEMPINYGSQIQEHHCVRKQAGLFDVSHMGVLDITGSDSKIFLRYALANDVAKLAGPGRAFYTCMLNNHGGVIDDLITYRLAEMDYRIILNASRREIDIQHLQSLAAKFEVTLTERTELCIVAVQGPQAIEHVVNVLGEEWTNLKALKPFQTLIQDDVQIARTGYTGEDGIEIVLPADSAIKLWQQLVGVGVKPSGLGARDTLRLEAGLNLYGADMDEQTSPLVSNLSWTVSFKDEARDFVGKQALLEQKQQGIQQQLMGIVMQEKGVLRNHQTIFFDDGMQGEITSGSFSPTLGYAIALARIPKNVVGNAYVERRGKKIPVKIVKPPFVRFGKKVFKSEEK